MHGTIVDFFPLSVLKPLILNSICPSKSWALETESGAERGRFVHEYSHSLSECCSSIESGLRWPWSTERLGGGVGGWEHGEGESTTSHISIHIHSTHINTAEAEVTKKLKIVLYDLGRMLNFNNQLDQSRFWSEIDQLIYNSINRRVPGYLLCSVIIVVTTILVLMSSNKTLSTQTYCPLVPKSWNNIYPSNCLSVCPSIHLSSKSHRSAKSKSQEVIFFFKKIKMCHLISIVLQQRWPGLQIKFSRGKWTCLFYTHTHDRYFYVFLPVKLKEEWVRWWVNPTEQNDVFFFFLYISLTPSIKLKNVENMNENIE